MSAKKQEFTEKEKKHHKQNIQSHTQRRREKSKMRVGGTMGFPPRAFIICDLKSYQSSTARMNTVASNYSNPRRSGRAGKRYAVNAHLLQKRDMQQIVGTKVPPGNDQKKKILHTTAILK